MCSRAMISGGSICSGLRVRWNNGGGSGVPKGLQMERRDLERDRALLALDDELDQDARRAEPRPRPGDRGGDGDRPPPPPTDGLLVRPALTPPRPGPPARPRRGARRPPSP